MTKNTFIALAAALKAQMPVRTPEMNHTEIVYNAVAYHQWTHDVLAVMRVLEQSNAQFNKGKFIAACGVPNLLME